MSAPPPRAPAWAPIALAALVLALSVALVAAIAITLGDAPLAATIDGVDWELLEPRWLALIGALPVVLFGSAGSLADLPRAQVALATLTRAALVGLLALALARPARTVETHRLSVVVLVDVSDSVTDAGLARAEEVVREVWAARGENDVQVVTFASDARALDVDPEAGPRLGRHAGDEGAATDLASALRLSYGLFAPGTLRRVLVVSDGAETEGHALAEAQRAAELGVRIDHLALAEGPPPEVAVMGLDVPDVLRVGQPFAVRARVFASRAQSARVRLYQGEALAGFDAVREVELAEGQTTIELRAVVHVAGPVTFRFELEPGGEDRWDANDVFTTTVVVPGRPTVLYVEGTQASASYFARALVAGELDVDVRTPRALPTSLTELERFDFVVLSDVPADEVSAGQQDALERYVRDVGGGFLMAGGERSFGLGGWGGTAMERMLPVRMDAERRRDQPSLALALVIDKSGSMSGEKIELAKEAARATAELLSPEDYLGVVAYDSQPSRIVRMQSAGNRIQILRDIGRLSAGGGTAIFPALDMAFSDLSVTRARIRHVILLTDGQTQESGLPELVSAMHAEGITVSVVGVGADVNRALLSQLADLGGGRAYFTTDPHHIPRIFTRETMTVARSSVVEEYFQPTISHPADFLRGIDLASAPFLHGYVATRARPEPAQVILRSDLGEPVLARWRVGLGWSLAWTSDVKNRWAIDWLRWPQFSRFFVQLVREHMRQRRRHELPMRAEVEGREARIVVDALDDDDTFIDDLASTAHVEGPMGAPERERSRLEVPLSQVAPGRYEARVPLDRFGSYVLTAEHRRGGEVVAESTAELTLPYPREYAVLEPDVALLSALSERTSGMAHERADALFDPGDATVRTHTEEWPRLVWIALGLFVLDLLLRRVRLFDRAFAG